MGSWSTQASGRTARSCSKLVKNYYKSVKKAGNVGIFLILALDFLHYSKKIHANAILILKYSSLVIMKTPPSLEPARIYTPCKSNTPPMQFHKRPPSPSHTSIIIITTRYQSFVMISLVIESLSLRGNGESPLDPPPSDPPALGPGPPPNRL